MRERAVVVNGVSKYYSMTGWRQGFILGPEKMMNPILRYHQYMITSTNTFAQWGAVEALRGDQSPSMAMVEEFRKRRDFLYGAVNRIPGFKCAEPQGAFYLFPSVEETGMDGYQMADFLLEKAGVATVAGECFGTNGADHIRLSYANSMDNLKAAADKMKEAIDGIR
jgi:aspartate/methionine/tyrosine aminotransferase